MTRHQHDADFDEAWVERNELVVRGRTPQGLTPRLAPRRYKSPPDWVVVDVVHDGIADADSSGAGESEEFRLTCPVDGLGAVHGICVAGRLHRRLVPLSATASPPVW